MLPLLAVFEPVALAIHLQNVDVVREPVEQGPGQPLAAQDFGPFIEWQIAGHQRGAPLIALARLPFILMSPLALTSNGGLG